MAQANFTVIRVGESVWSTWEPENGVFDLDWLQPVLDGAHERGIGVILGTPTYAAPPWLARLYPEINVERSTGQRMGWGARQEIDYTHPAFLFHAERVIRQDHRPIRRPSRGDRVPGRQRAGQRDLLQPQRFPAVRRPSAPAGTATVEEINEQWGLTYWSHRLSTWADLWTPGREPATPVRPGLAALPGSAHHRVHRLAGGHRPGIRPRRPVRHHLHLLRTAARSRTTRSPAGSTSRPATPTTGCRTRSGAADRRRDEADQGWTTDGTWALYHSADRMFSSRQEPFLVTETNAQAIGHAWQNEPPYDGQWRQAAWALVSRGATMIEYWHWHTLPFGAETYWGGVLPHSRQPGRTYQRDRRASARSSAGPAHRPPD